MTTRPFLLGTAFLVACAHAQRGGGDACRPVTGQLPASASTRDMRGNFVLTMTATGGAHAGRTARGTLSLEPQDSALVAVAGATQPLRGTAAIALEAVGAVRMGDLADSAADSPGVGVYEQRPAAGAPGAPTVIIRVGSASNARGPQPFDAGYTALYVKRITGRGFAGGWASSAGPTYPPRRAEGYFCAVRAEP